MVPLLTRIDQQLAVATDPSKRGELLAEKACYLARVGEFGGAERIVDELRVKFQNAGDVRVSALAMLAEGLIEFFARTNERAFDRILRSHALCQFAMDQESVQLTAAWLAHIEFNRLNYTCMSAMLGKVFNQPKRINPAANLRASIVVGDALLTCGNVALARRWYERSRRIAVHAGDESAIASIIYNRAVLTINNLRLVSCASSIEPSTARAALMEISSAESFHSATGHSSMFHLIEIAKARVFLLGGEFLGALSILERLAKETELAFGYTCESQLIQLEYAICLFKTGSHSASRSVFQRLELSQCCKMAVDDEFQFWHLYSILAAELEIVSNAGKERKEYCLEQFKLRNKSLLNAMENATLPEPL